MQSFANVILVFFPTWVLYLPDHCVIPLGVPAHLFFLYLLALHKVQLILKTSNFKS